MKRIRLYLLFAAMATIAACGTTNTGDMYDPNAPVTAISISTFGSVDSSNRTIALPPGEDDLLVSLRNAFSSDGWATSSSTTNTRYLMQIETKVWSYDQRLSYINLSIVDEKTGAKILAGVRKTYSPNDPAIDVKAVAAMVVSSLRQITTSAPDKPENSQ